MKERVEKNFDGIDEAGILAKSALSRAAQKNLIEARILGQNRYKKLYFFFENVANVEYFKQNKEQIKENLRAQYRKKLALYKEVNFIFYDIEARLGSQMWHRSKEEELTLQRGIAKLSAILEKNKLDKIGAVLDKNKFAKLNAIVDKGKFTECNAVSNSNKKLIA